MSTVIEPTALLSLRETGPNSLVERADNFIVSMEKIVADSEALVPAANEFTVTNEAEFQFADEMRVELESQAKQLDSQRIGITRPIDDLKSYIMAQVKPAIDNNKSAAAIYNRKALDFRRAERQKAEEARREAEAEQRRKQEELRRAAEKREAEANKLKTEAARARAQAEADALKMAAEQTPIVMAVSAPVPVATASNVVEKWDAQVVNASDFLRWLADHPEWMNIVSFGKGPMNRLASQYKDTLPIPGVSITSSEAFRKKASR